LTFSPKVNLVLIGAPGSGKGTQSQFLSSRLGYKHISTGDLLRNEVKLKSDIGQKVEAIISSGSFVSDDILIELIEKNCDLSSSVFIFDGFPRTIEQAKMLDLLLNNFSYKALYFNIKLDLVVNRLSNRRISPCGKYIYNLISSPPKIAGICDVTKLPLIQREDDKEEIVRKRLELYTSEVLPIIDYYKKKSLIVDIDAENDPEIVFNKIKDIL
jgi:adenylate kinase